MKLTILLFPLLILGFLAGCAPSGQNTARYVPPGTPGGRLCVFQCRRALEHCLDSCHLKERTCTIEMQSQAIKDYEAYTREQFQSRAAVELRPSDFEKPERCVDSDCRSLCNNIYDDCFEKCGGSISNGLSKIIPSL